MTKTSQMDDRGCAWISNGIQYRHDGIVPCCRFKKNDNLISTNDILAWQTFVKSNKNFNYENLKTTSCIKCFLEEKAGASSFRLRTNQQLLDLIDQPPIGQVTHLHVEFSNFCNFKCRYCGPSLSTTWNDDIEEMTKLDLLDSFQVDKNDKVIKYNKTETLENENIFLKNISKLDLSNLRYLAIAATGEPFLTRNLDKLLEILQQKSDLSKVKLQINTNTSIFPKTNVLDFLSYFEYVDLRSSIESVGKLAEYVRKGLDWEIFESNLYKWKDFAEKNKNINYRLHLAHSIYTINKILEFDQWFEPLKLECVSEMVYGNACNPLAILSTEQIKILQSRIEKLKNHTVKKHLTTYFSEKNQKLYDSDWKKKEIEKFKNNHQILDTVRKEKLENVNKELYNWIYNDNQGD